MRTPFQGYLKIILVTNTILIPWLFGNSLNLFLNLMFLINLTTTASIIVCEFKNFVTKKECIKYIQNLSRKILLSPFAFLWGLLIISIIQICNYTSEFDKDLSYFVRFKDPIPWLPSTVDRVSTLESIKHILFLILYGCNLSYYNKKYQQLSCKIVFNNFLVIIFISIFMEVFNIKFYTSESQLASKGFGIFPYRNNAAAYFLIHIPVLFDYSKKILSKSAMRINQLIALMTYSGALFATLMVPSRAMVAILSMFLLIKLTILFKTTTGLLRFYISLFVLCSMTTGFLGFSTIGSNFTKGSHWKVLDTKRPKVQSISLSLNSGRFKKSMSGSIILRDNFNGRFNKNELELRFEKQSIQIFVRSFGNLIFNYITDGNSEKFENDSNVVIKSDHRGFRINLDDKVLFFSAELNSKYKYYFLTNNLLLDLINFNGIKLLLENNGNIVLDSAENESLMSYVSQISLPRFLATMTVLDLLQEQKMFGYGLGSFSSIYNLNRDTGVVWEAWLHNDPLELILCTGFLGFLLLIYLFLVIFGIKEKLTAKHLLKEQMLLLFAFSLLDFPFQVSSVQVTTIFYICNFRLPLRSFSNRG